MVVVVRALGALAAEAAVPTAAVGKAELVREAAMPAVEGVGGLEKGVVGKAAVEGAAEARVVVGKKLAVQALEEMVVMAMAAAATAGVGTAGAAEKMAVVRAEVETEWVQRRVPR